MNYKDYGSELKLHEMPIILQTLFIIIDNKIIAKRKQNQLHNTFKISVALSVNMLHWLGLGMRWGLGGLRWWRGVGLGGMKCRLRRWGLGGLRLRRGVRLGVMKCRLRRWGLGLGLGGMKWELGR